MHETLLYFIIDILRMRGGTKDYHIDKLQFQTLWDIDFFRFAV